MLLLFTVTAFAQTKEETVKKINDLYIKSYNREDYKIEYVKQDAYYKNSLKIRKYPAKHPIGSAYHNQSATNKYLDLMSFEVDDLKVSKSITGEEVYFVNAKKKSVFPFLSSKEDAEKLIHYLKHLIKIMKTD